MKRPEMSDLWAELGYLYRDIQDLKAETTTPMRGCGCNSPELWLRRELEGFCVWVCASCGAVERITAWA